MISSALLRAELDKFYGSEQFFRDPITKLVYTEGVQFLFAKAECYWLLPTFHRILASNNCRDWFYQFKILVKNGCAVVSIDDGNGTVIAAESIYYTDMPEGEYRIWYEHGTLLLPSEH